MDDNDNWLLFTIEKAASRLKLSKKKVEKSIQTGELETETLDGELFITRKSIEAFERKQKQLKEEGKDVDYGRRNFGVSLATLCVALYEAFKNPVAYEGLAQDLGQDNQRAEVQDLFRYWDRLNLFPGAAHPKFEGGFHPDVAQAQNMISRLMVPNGKVDFRPLKDCLHVPMEKDLLLVGGPISNGISRQLHGYSMKNQKISANPDSSNKMRWHFFYPEATGNDKKYFRFVNGKERSTMPKAIVDTLAEKGYREKLYSPIYPKSERIISDYLLLTVTKNPYAPDANIIDVADLHGQGNKAFAIIMNSKERRRELFQEVGGKPHFQALYEVKVEHNDFTNITEMGDIDLKGVYLMS